MRESNKVLCKRSASLRAGLRQSGSAFFRCFPRPYGLGYIMPRLRRWGTEKNQILWFVGHKTEITLDARRRGRLERNDQITITSDGGSELRPGITSKTWGHNCNVVLIDVVLTGNCNVVIIVVCCSITEGADIRGCSPDCSIELDGAIGDGNRLIVGGPGIVGLYDRSFKLAAECAILTFCNKSGVAGAGGSRVDTCARNSICYGTRGDSHYAGAAACAGSHNTMAAAASTCTGDACPGATASSVDPGAIGWAAGDIHSGGAAGCGYRHRIIKGLEPGNDLRGGQIHIAVRQAPQRDVGCGRAIRNRERQVGRYIGHGAGAAETLSGAESQGPLGINDQPTDIDAAVIFR